MSNFDTKGAILDLLNKNLSSKAVRIEKHIKGMVSKQPTAVLQKNVTVITQPRIPYAAYNYHENILATLAPTPLKLAPTPVKSNMVTLQLTAGLGNQIFMILAGLGYCEKYNKNLVISKLHISKSKKPHENNSKMLSKIFPNIPWVEKVENVQHIKQSSSFKYDKLLSSTKNVVLTGYFQNELYFPSEKFIPNIRSKYYPDTYFIHIRAGDYIRSEVHYLELKYYYKECFEQLPSTTKYIVFSNDNMYAEEYMKQYNIEYSICNKTDALETLIEMSNCAGGICANSTFSWLGAFFQDKTKGKRFMPSRWVNNRNCHGIYPNWATVIDLPDCKIYDIFIKNNNIYLISTYITPNDTSVTITVNDVILSEFSRKEYEPLRYFYGSLPDSNTLVIKINNMLYKTIVVDDIEHIEPIQTRHKLAYATLFKDDYSFIEHSVNYYRKQGVDCFYLYYNGSVLPENMPQGEDIIYRLWDIQPYMYKSTGCNFIHNAQTAFLTMFQLKYFDDNEYVILGDLDEFIIVYNSDITLVDKLNQLNEDVVKVKNHWATIDGNTITYNSLALDENKQAKCIYKGSYTKAIGIHYPKDNVTYESSDLRMLHMNNVLHPERLSMIKPPLETYLLNQQNNIIKNNKRDFKVVYSIGIRCHTEMMLKDLHLTKFASIFGSLNIKSHANIIKCFDTKFDLLFNEDNLIYTKDIDSFKSDNDTSGFRTLNKVFDNVNDYHDATIAHHDLSTKKGKSHFERGIQRLNIITEQNIPILFIDMSASWDFKNNYHNQELIDSILRYGFTNMMLFSFYEDNSIPESKLIYSDKYHHVYTIPSKNKLNYVRDILYSNFNLDNLLTIEYFDKFINI